MAETFSLLKLDILQEEKQQIYMSILNRDARPGVYRVTLNVLYTHRISPLNVGWADINVFCIHVILLLRNYFFQLIIINLFLNEFSIPSV